MDFCQRGPRGWESPGETPWFAGLKRDSESYVDTSPRVPKLKGLEGDSQAASFYR